MEKHCTFPRLDGSSVVFKHSRDLVVRKGKEELYIGIREGSFGKLKGVSANNSRHIRQ